jgi:hypothetical protein
VSATPRTPVPDRYKPASDPCWQAHDCLDTITSEATRIAARAARARVRARHDPRFGVPAGRLDRPWGDRRALALAGDHTRSAR